MQAPYSRTYFDLLCEQSARAGSAPCVISREGVLTYAEFEARARRAAGVLRGLGIRRHDRVGLLCNNRREWLEICFGAHALGAVLFPFSTWSRPAELAYLLDHSKPAVVAALEQFGKQDFAATLAAWAGRILSLSSRAIGNGPVYFDLCARTEPLDTLPPGEGASAQDDAFVLSTSGSSAQPKAVRLKHCALIENAFNIGERQRLTPDDRVLVAPPLFWIYGCGNALLAALTHGSAVVLVDRFEPAEVLRLIEEHRCTSIYTLPAMTHALISDPAFTRQRTSSVRTGLTIGSAEDVRLVAETLGVPQICNIYGLTETYGNCCVTSCDAPLAERMAGQGRPLPGVTLRIVHPQTREPLPSGQIGEVEVAGYITPGYFKPAATDQVNSWTGDGFFRTRDLGSLGEGDTFHFAGRCSDIIKRAGINVSPSEIEAALQLHPLVRQAAVVGAPDKRRGELIFAFIVSTADGSDIAETLRRYCNERLSSYKVPDYFELCDSLPITDTGKLARGVLRERALRLMGSERQAGT